MSPKSVSGVQNLFSQKQLFVVEINKIAYFQFWETFTSGLFNMVFFQTRCRPCLDDVWAFHTREVCDIILLVRRNKKRAVFPKSREIYLLNRVQIVRRSKKRAVFSKSREIYLLNHVQKTRQTYAVVEDAKQLL